MKRAALLVFVLSCACARPAPTVPAGASDCEGACTVLAFYGCPEAKPVRIGARERTCNERCTQVESVGYVSLEPACVVAHASSLTEIRSLCGWECK